MREAYEEVHSCLRDGDCPAMWYVEVKLAELEKESLEGRALVQGGCFGR